MTRVKCANCGCKFEIEKKYDEHFDSVLMCPKCSWQVSLWGFDLVEEATDVDYESVKLPTDDYV